jgi:hypothetical protein
MLDYESPEAIERYNSAIEQLEKAKRFIQTGSYDVAEMIINLALTSLTQVRTAEGIFDIEKRLEKLCA